MPDWEANCAQEGAGETAAREPVSSESDCAGEEIEKLTRDPARATAGHDCKARRAPNPPRENWLACEDPLPVRRRPGLPQQLPPPPPLPPPPHPERPPAAALPLPPAPLFALPLPQLPLPPRWKPPAPRSIGR